MSAARYCRLYPQLKMYFAPSAATTPKLPFQSITSRSFSIVSSLFRRLLAMYRNFAAVRSEPAWRIAARTRLQADAKAIQKELRQIDQQIERLLDAVQDGASIGR
jgi:hypothetical protein